LEVRRFLRKKRRNMPQKFAQAPSDLYEWQTHFLPKSFLKVARRTDDTVNMDDTALIPATTIEEIVGHRNKAIELYREAFEKIAIAEAAFKAANAEVREACGNVNMQDWVPYGGDRAAEVAAFYNAVKLPDVEQYQRVSRRLCDLRVWGSIIERTDLKRLMDKEAKDTLRSQMAYIPEEIGHNGELINGEEIAKGLPEVSVDTIAATLTGFAADAGTIFQRGISNGFAKLDRRFKSHDGFRVGSRIILTDAFDGWGSWHYGRHRDSLIDIERVFLVLDGKKATDKYTGVIDVITEGRRGGFGIRQSEHEGDYFKIRIFKNGNAHLWFSRDDLVLKVNKLLANYYGEVLGYGHDTEETEEEIFSNRALTPARRFGFFPTPPETVHKMLDGALYVHAGEPVLTILEPSAGTGNISSILAAEQESGAWERHEKRRYRHKVDVVEIQEDHFKGLETSGLYRRAFHRDFLRMEPEQTGLYDLIIMNPPFDMQRDIDHVTHAWKFLKPGGTLISIMSAGTEFRENKKAKAFRAMLERHRARWTDLPAGTFSSVGTNVNTCYIRVQKPKEG
jgi:hypothetical protein